MKTNRTNPVLSRPNQGKDSREFLKDLEELMRRNKGGFGAMAFDTGSNRPYRVGGKVQQPNQETPSLAWRPGEVTPPQDYSLQFPQLQPEVQPEQIEQQPEQPQGVSIEDFLSAFDQVYNAPENQLPISGVGQGIDYNQGIASSPDGGIIYRDGSIHYEDGTMRVGDPNATGIASVGPGQTRYSDGSIRQASPYGMSSRGQDPAGRDLIGYSDNSTRYGQYQYQDGQPISMPGGQSGLISGVFGQDRPITQAYGNINPLEPTKGHVNVGTDIRTRDLTDRGYKLPVGATVVQVFQDDGTRFGTQSGHKGYGNSILVQLPTGEMLRFSHMSQMADLKPGDQISAGQVFGAPGATGNATGEHLDLEYYNSKGQIDNPQNFSGFSDPQGLRTPLPNQQPPGSMVQPNQSIPQATQPQQTQQQPPTPMTDAITKVAEAPQQVAQAIQQAPAQISQAIQPMSDVRQNLATVPEQVAQKAGVQADFGVSEAVKGQDPMQARVSALSQQPKAYNPYRQLAGNISERIGDTLGIPEGALSETIAGGATKRTNQALASEIGSQPEQVPGIRQNLADVGRDIVGKAGQGVEAIKTAGSGIKNLIGQGLDTLTPRRAIGDQSSQVAEEVGQTAQMSSMQPKNDIRDPFFKMGGAQMYSKYIAPNAQDKAGGALTMDLFSPDFFSNADNVANVFGSTFMGKEATDKFRSSETSKYPMSSFSPIGYGEGEWSGDYRNQVDQYNQKGQTETSQYNKSVTDYLKSIPSVLKSAFSFSEPAKPTSQRLSFGSVSKTDSAPKMSYAVNQPMNFDRSQMSSTPQMSSVPEKAPQMSFARNMPQMSVAPKPIPAPVPTPPQKPQPQKQPSLQDYLSRGKTEAQWYAETGQQSTLDERNRNPQPSAPSASQVSQMQSSGTPSSSYQTVDGRVVNASPGQVISMGSDGWAQQNRPYESPVKDASAQLASNPSPQSLQQLLKNLFGRWF